MISQEVSAELLTTITAARNWLLELDTAAVQHRPGSDRWSIQEVVGHLIDSACNNHQRFIRAQQPGELSFPKYDQNEWVERAGYQDQEWRDVVELWWLYNKGLASVILRIPEGRMSAVCTITPYEPCTLEFLVRDYLDHLNHHLGKIRERLN